MRFSGWVVAAGLALAAMQSGAGEAQAMQIKATSANPIVAIGVTELEEAVPDTATLTIGVEALSPDAKKALDEANKKMQTLMAAVKAAKFDPKDVQTSSVTVAEDFDFANDPPVSRGFKAMNGVTLTVRAVPKLQKLISDLVAAGATMMEGPYFSVENEDLLTDKARMKAFDTAKRRALAYAGKAGFKSVRLVMVTENADYYEGVEYAAAAAAAGEAAAAIADTPIEPGVVQRTVTATFQFEMVP